MQAIVKTEAVEKSYQLGRTEVRALRGVDIEVGQGDFVSVMGPSGCGKTTLLNLIGCIDRPTGGRVYFDGRDVSSFSDDQEADTRLSGMGFIFQSFNLVPVLTAAQNVEFPLILAKVKKRERGQRVDEAISLVGLDDVRDHRPDELSGGQRQRVAIARALVNRPRLVIADEPTANLDSETGEAILSEMARLNREDGVSFLFSTHDERIVAYARRIVRLRDGVVIGEEER